MTALIVWERRDGGVALSYINPDYTDPSQIEDAKIKARAAVESSSGPVIRHDYDSDLLPEPSDDERFFDAWEWIEGAVSVNMSKARRMHMDAIRRVRDAELVAADITYLRAVEAGDTNAQARIAAEKQILRDIPQTFDLTSRTPAQLKEKWPPELPPQSG